MFSEPLETRETVGSDSRVRWRSLIHDFITILSGVVWMRTVSVSEQSAGSATKMPFLASTCMIIRKLFGHQVS